MALQILFCSLIAALLGYLVLHADFLLILGVSGLAVVIVGVASLRFKAFLMVLYAVKPFIDLTWDIKLFSLGGTGINSLSVVAAIVFLVVTYKYFVCREGAGAFNEGYILLFLGLNVFISVVGVLYFDRKLLDRVNAVMRLFDSYLLYLILHRYITDEADRLRVVGIIWVSTLLVNIVNIIMFSAGHYNIDVSQDVERFAGLYNDPGVPSFNAVMSLLFGTLYLEMLRRRGRPPLRVLSAYAFTVAATGILLMITITKGAVMMFLVFLVLWFGIYKRKTALVLPLIALGLYFLYVEVEDVQKRIQPDIRFLTAEHVTIEDLRPIGTGRVGLWESLITHYTDDYFFFQKMFGSARGFGAHNQYIAYLMQIGLVGLTVFLVIIIRFFMRLASLYKLHRSPEIYMGIVVLAIFSVLGVTGHPFDYTTLMWYMMALLSTINCRAWPPLPQPAARG